MVLTYPRAQYGAPSDYDEWARIINDDSWSWDQFGQYVNYSAPGHGFTMFCRYFRKFEKYEADPSFPEVDVSLKGSNGPMRVGYFHRNAKASKDFVEACKGIGIPPSADFTQPAGACGTNKVCGFTLSSSCRD